MHDHHHRALLIGLILLAAGCARDAPEVPAATEEPAMSRQEEVSLIHAVLASMIDLSDQGLLRGGPATTVLTGEALTRWEMDTFGPAEAEIGMIQLLGPGRAAARIVFSDDDRRTDCYFYLVREESWKVQAMRSMALTGLLHKVLEELETSSDRPEDADSIRDNIVLTLSTDAELRAWFGRNRPSLERLVAAAQPELEPGARGIADDDGVHAGIEAMLRGLNLQSISLSRTGNVEIVIGGVVDNTVGFLFAPADEPPGIDPTSYIWVEKLADGWYLFRTT
jgi:hypothetical protein